MEGAEFVLESKLTKGLYVKLTKHRRKPQWEFTEDFEEASYFENAAHIDGLMELHSVPRGTMKARPYTTAYSEWLNTTPKLNL
jgi:hypothetical protein